MPLCAARPTLAVSTRSHQGELDQDAEQTTSCSETGKLLILYTVRRMPYAVGCVWADTN